MLAVGAGEGRPEDAERGAQTAKGDADLMDAFDVLPVAGRILPGMHLVQVVPEDGGEGVTGGLVGGDGGVGLHDYRRLSWSYRRGPDFNRLTGAD